MDNLNNFQINRNKLAHWENLLKNWVLLVLKYCYIMDGDDAPYFHTERANVGILSAAAWNIEWLALEAFNSEKRGKKRGRCDLYFYTHKKTEEYLEAKLKWSFDTKDRIIKYLKEATDSAKELPKDGKRIGLLFICANFHKHYQAIIDSEIDKAINIAKKITCDAIAWSFPIPVRKEKWADGRIYPGVILLASCVD